MSTSIAIEPNASQHGPVQVKGACPHDCPDTCPLLTSGPVFCDCLVEVQRG